MGGVHPDNSADFNHSSLRHRDIHDVNEQLARFIRPALCFCYLNESLQNKHNVVAAQRSTINRPVQAIERSLLFRLAAE